MYFYWQIRHKVHFYYFYDLYQVVAREGIEPSRPLRSADFQKYPEIKILEKVCCVYQFRHRAMVDC